MSCLQSDHRLGESGAEVVEGWRPESQDSRSDVGLKIGAERVLRRDNSGFWGGVEWRWKFLTHPHPPNFFFLHALQHIMAGLPDCHCKLCAPQFPGGL